MDTKRFQKFYLNTDYFKYTNPNPTAAQKKTLVWDKPDCEVRALALSIGVDWLTAYDYLSAKAREEYTIPNDGRRTRDWFIQGGGVWTACKAEKGKKRMTCREFAEAHKSGRYIVSIASHVVACVNGYLLDTWNCGERAVVGFIDMAEFHL